MPKLRKKEERYIVLLPKLLPNLLRLRSTGVNVTRSLDSALAGTARAATGGTSREAKVALPPGFEYYNPPPGEPLRVVSAVAPQCVALPCVDCGWRTALWCDGCEAANRTYPRSRTGQGYPPRYLALCAHCGWADDNKCGICIEGTLLGHPPPPQIEKIPTDLQVACLDNYYVNLGITWTGEGRYGPPPRRRPTTRAELTQHLREAYDHHRRVVEPLYAQSASAPIEFGRHDGTEWQASR